MIEMQDTPEGRREIAARIKSEGGIRIINIRPIRQRTSASEQYRDREMSDTETRLNAEFDAWFKRLQALTKDELDPDDWASRWYDGYTPEHALEDGPEED